MAEARNYRIFYTVKLRHYEDQESLVEAYTADDALTQFKILRGGEWFKVTKIEPLPHYQGSEVVGAYLSTAANDTSGQNN